jgi:two-component system, OmpR family, phosphate regulon sensor histidine kinase PhoR
MLRIAIALSALLIAYGLGHAIANETGALAGGLITMIGLLLWDQWNASRVMQWLKHDTVQAPKLIGFWGELQYRLFKRHKDLLGEVSLEQGKLNHFLQAIQASPNGVALLDGDDKIEWFNDQAAQHLGLDQERDRGQRIVYVVRNPEFVSYLAAANFQSPITISLDSHHRLELQCFGFGSMEDTPTGIVATQSKLLLTRDVTEQERTDIMRRDFVANVSHELKTPLTVLKGFVETMQSLELSTAERVHYLDVMHTQADRMHNLVIDLLTLAKLEADTRPPESSILKMAPLMEALRSQATGLSMGRHRIAMQVDMGDLLGNQSEIMSAFSNLVSNAVRYTPTGGEIVLSWKINHDGATFSVKDTGIGIASDHISRLTERFYRVDKGRGKLDAQGQELHGGTGLGLAIAKHALQRHGAELVIESVQGEGSVFSALMPMQRIIHTSAVPTAQAPLLEQQT